MDSELLAFFDLVCDKIEAHPIYGPKLAEAAERGELLVLNYHTHGPGQAYCVAVCSGLRPNPVIDLPVPPEELAHIRGIGANAEECEPRMTAFAARLVERYGLEREPVIFLDGAPFEAR